MKTFNNTLIILNAPPNAGKDTIADAIVERTGMEHRRFKDHLYQLTADTFNMDVELFTKLATDRETKEVPHDLLVVPCEHTITSDEGSVSWEHKLRPMSPRAALIYVSEVLYKPKEGNDYFGRMFAEGINLETGTVASDGGFEDELYPCIDKLSKDNTFIISFTRQGAETFEGDSRDWIRIDGVPTYKTTNDGTVDEVVDDILNFVSACRIVQQQNNSVRGNHE